MHVTLREGDHDTLLPEQFVDLKPDITSYSAQIHIACSMNPEICFEYQCTVAEIRKQNDRLGLLQYIVMLIDQLLD